MLKESLFDLAPRSLDCSRRSVLWPSSLHLLHRLHLFPPSLPTELHNDTGDGMNCKVPHNNKTSIHPQYTHYSDTLSPYIGRSFSNMSKVQSVRGVQQFGYFQRQMSWVQNGPPSDNIGRGLPLMMEALVQVSMCRHKIKVGCQVKC